MGCCVGASIAASLGSVGQWNGAIWHQPVLILVSTPMSTDASSCCFAAAVCVQVFTGAFGPAQKLTPPGAEAMTINGGGVGALSMFAGVSRRSQARLAGEAFARSLGHVGCVFLRADDVLSVQPGSEADSTGG